MDRRRGFYSVQDWVRIGVLFWAYLSTAKIGLTLNAIGGFATLVWPPTGIALAALLLWGYRYWPGIAAAALLVNLWAGAPLPVACGIALGNTLEAVAGAWLMHRVGFKKPLCNLREVLALVVFAALLSTLLSASIGVLSLRWGGLLPVSALLPTWRAWWIGDMLGDLVIAPLFLILAAGHPFRLPSFKVLLEITALVCALVIINWVVFWKFSFPEIQNFPISYLIFPPLIWTALRFGPRGVALATCLTSLLATGGTLWGHGPFTQEVLSESLLSLQVFMGVVAVSMLILAVIVAERLQSEKRALAGEEAVRMARDHLETKVRLRTRELRQINLALRKTYLQLRASHQELKTTQWQLIQAEKMETVGRLAAGVAHEVKNPLSIITLGVQYLLRAPQSPSEKEAAAVVLEDIHHAIKRADTVVKGLMDFSASQQLNIREESLAPIIEQSLRLVRHPMSLSNIQVLQEIPEGLPPLRLDKNKIEQAFVNLFMNSIYAMPQGGTLLVRAHRERGWVIAEVEDTGTGIPPEKVSKVFDPFFTTKPTGQGTGLGLTVTRHILELHKGELQIQNRDGGGVVAVLRFKILRKGGECDGQETRLGCG